MLFEAPGVYDSRNHPNPSERVNWGRLRAFRDHLMSQHRSERFAAMVASDQLFASNPGAAYAEAWAVVFFLIETDSSKLSLYLHRTASRPPFEPYPAAERTADFTAVFGNDWRMLEARFLRFIEGVK
jgi:hypothetical protein